ncbi:unnamed protein product [Staurois parvus]|uniref:Uncharacterized protein n=1 Tax=Staurois parvus TaxID=386267 RepID=A0ABN9DDM5_9NEOB|nr:unnamed protein product [Staurois parvus]
MRLTLVTSEKNASYIGSQCKNALTRVVSGKMSFTLEVSGKNVPYIRGQLEVSLTLVISRKNIPYIGGQ